MTRDASSEAQAIVDRARADQTDLILEPAAKRLLELFGIPVPVGRACGSLDEALAAAEAIGYPVVVKVLSPRIVHKSDLGGVRLGIGSADQLRRSHAELLDTVRSRAPQAEIQGVLVERQETGCELFVGARRDPSFGPLILFGVGGISVEILGDIACRLAPLTAREAEAMIREIRGYPLLRGARGRQPVSETAVAEVLLAVSRLMEALPEIAELDINPLIAAGERVVAADARAVLGAAPPTPAQQRDDSRPDFQRLFSPRAVAVVGATTGRYSRGRKWLRLAQKAGFRGRLYAVSRQETVDDWPTYQRLTEIPEAVDLAMIEVGRDVVPDVLRDCVAHGIPWGCIHAAGFAETGSEEGVERERQLRAIVAGSDTWFIGPNAFGPYSPAAGIVPADDVTTQPGGVAIVSQSGTILLALGKIAEEKHIGIGKGLSYGSEGDARVHQLLEYLADDQETELVALYVEGVRDPTRFVDALERAARRKPVLVFKAGVTDAGSRAAVSHSGALAASAQVWTAVVRKAGAVRVTRLDELVDGVIGFLRLEDVRGRRVALITCTGGAAVPFTDACVEAGFLVPELSATTQEALRQGLPPGTSVRNPVDVGHGYFQEDVLPRCIAALSTADAGIDLILLHIPMEILATTLKHAPWVEERFLSGLLSVAATSKPLAVVLPYTVADARRAEIESALSLHGLAVYASVERALRAATLVQEDAARRSQEGALT